ncbi:MAG: hypothetical protein IPN34_12375 [Planctomycetes bacterium]|nr:hypothetical protein [Planctomycetota bacterium]
MSLRILCLPLGAAGAALTLALVSADRSPRPVPPSPDSSGIAAEAAPVTEASPFERAPLAFVENRGQFASPAAFVLRREKLSAHFERDAITLDLAAGAKRSAVRLEIEGALPSAELRGEAPQAAQWNFLRGTSSAWQSGVPSYASLRWSGVQPGIDLRVRDGGGVLEYDVLLEPGAELERFALRCAGHRALRVDASGALVIETELGELVQKPPRTWEVLADGTQRAVDCRFTVLDGERFGFAAPLRDESLALVVDPGLVWSTHLGGTADEFGWKLLRYADGDLLCVGLTTSNDAFPPALGTYQPATGGGSSDNLIARFAADGSTLRWATYIGGDGGEGPFDAAFDAAGDIHFCGGTTSSNFPTTPGAYNRTFNFSFQEVFYAELSANGQTLNYGTYLGGTGLDWALELELFGNDVVLAGCTDSTNFPVTTGAYQTTYGGGLTDLWVARLSPNGNGAADLAWATYLGGNDEDGKFSNPFDLASMIEVDLELGPRGNLAIFGRTASTNFPTTPGAFQPVHRGNGAADLFLCALSASGSSFLWGTFLGGDGEETAGSLHKLPAGGFVVTGTSSSSNFPTTVGALDASANGGEDAVIAEVDGGGGSLSYASYLGGSTKDDVIRSVLSPSGYVNLLIRTDSTDFPATVGAYDTSYAQGPFGEDIAIARVQMGSRGARDLRYATYLGGFLQDIAIDGVWDGRSALAITGLTMGQGFPTTGGSWAPSYAGGVFDAFVAALELLPVGAELNGRSFPACNGGIEIAVSEQPRLGASGFAITAANAPGNASGLLFASFAGLANAIPVAGIELWIDPAQVFLNVPVASDAQGYAHLDVPIANNPAYLGATTHLQAIFASTCAPQGLDATPALRITVQ